MAESQSMRILGKWLGDFAGKIPSRQLSLLVRVAPYGVAVVTVFMALFARELIGPAGIGLQFVTFFPAVALTAVFGGFWPGMLAMAISAFLASYLYIPPYRTFSFDFHRATLMSNLAFYLDGLIVCGAIEAMHNHFRNSRLADERLAENRNLLSALVEGTTDMIFIKDGAGRYLHCNGAHLRFSGYTMEDLAGKDVFSVFPNEQANEIACKDAEVIASGMVTTFEETIRQPHGEERHLLTTKGPIFDEEGKISGLFGIARDVTEIRRAQSQLRQNAERINAHIENSPLALVAWDRDLNVTQWGGEAERMFGWSASETLHKPLMDLNMVFEEDIPLVQQAMEKIRRAESKYVINTNRNYTRDGNVLHCVWYNTVLRDENGDISSVLSQVLDVTEQKLSEKALKESEEFNRRIIESTSDCVKVLDLQGNLLSMSESGQRQLEPCEYERYLGQNWIEFWHECDRQAAMNATASAREGRRSRFVAYRPTANRAPKWWHVVVTPMLGASGKTERLLAISRDITDRMQEEEQFRLMIRTSLDGFWITDLLGNFLEVNDVYCQLLGYSRDELLTMCISDIEAKENPWDTERHIRRLQEAGCDRFETRHRARDGRILDMEASVNYTPLSGGRLYCFLRDITERKRSDELLKRQRNHLEEEVLRRTAELTESKDALEASFREIDDLYQHAPCGYHSLDCDGNIVRINNTELNMLGYSREELIGRPMRDLLTPGSCDRFRRDFAKLKEQGKINGVQTELVRKDGSMFPALVNASVIRNERGEFVMSRATVYDMTEQKQAEQIRERLDRALRLLSEGNSVLFHAGDEQGLLDSICRLVVETGGYLLAWVGFAGYDADKSIRPVAQFGNDEGYVSGLNLSWEDNERGQGATGSAIRTGETCINQHWNDNPNQKRWLGDASMRGYHSSIALPIFFENHTLGSLNIYSGDPDAFVPEEVRLLEELVDNLAFGIDALRVREREALAGLELEIHRRHLEQLVEQRTAELSAAKIEAERANNAKSRFLAAASHDLRQPISALKLYTGVLCSKLGPDDRGLSNNMQECIAGLSELLSKLLDYSKLQAGAVTAQMSDFPVDEVLVQVRATHAPEAQARGIELRIASCGLSARTDQMLFQRIVGNLVSNAILYTVRGGVLVASRRRQGKMWIEVWDTGIGIPEGSICEIFEEFRQLGDDARTRGSGLGLAIVARTAELLGLQIRVASRPGRGSMFAIEFPPGKTHLASRDAKPVIRNRGARIAVVDDNPFVLDALVLALTMQNKHHEVISAPSGKHLLEKLDNRPPDILLCDNRLAAGETGFDVIAMVRTAFGKSIPAVVITGDINPSLMRNMSEKDIVIRHKPLDLAALNAHIEEATSRPAV